MQDQRLSVNREKYSHRMVISHPTEDNAGQIAILKAAASPKIGLLLLIPDRVTDELRIAVQAISRSRTAKPILHRFVRVSFLSNRIFLQVHTPANQPIMVDPLERLKVLINSSTPIVVIETVEEMRAVMLVRAAGGELNLPVFEWSIADGLTRAGGVPVNSAPLASRVESK